MSADVDALPDMLARLKLGAMRDRLDGLLEAARGDLSLRETLALLCRAEVSRRQERRIQMGTGIAKFPRRRTLEAFDFAAQPSLDAKQVRDLAACRWVANGDALLIQGSPGVGKTHLAIALGREAIRHGHSVLFTPATALVTTLVRAHAEGRLEQQLAQLSKPKLLIVDEFGYLPFEPAAAHLLFQLVSRRYERGSILVTSNRAVGDWGAVLGDQVVATAILDRLPHHSHVLTIRGDSYRLREKRRSGLLQATPAPALAGQAMPVAPKADHVGDLLRRLRPVRKLGLPPEIAGRIHKDRLSQLVREGHASDAHQLGRYATHRRRAILAATVLDLESRLTNAVLEMADKLIGGMFAKARSDTKRRLVASAGDVGRLMRMFHGTIEALVAAQANGRDALDVVDETVGWAKLLRVRPEVKELAERTSEDPLVRAADRWKTLRKFAPALIEALEFRAACVNDPMLAALELMRDLNHTGRRDTPPDAPMPFRKEWRRLVLDGERPIRLLHETAVLATLRDKLPSGDVWVGRSSNHRRFDSYLLPRPAVPATVA